MSSNHIKFLFSKVTHTVPRVTTPRSRIFGGLMWQKGPPSWGASHTHSHCCNTVGPRTSMGWRRNMYKLPTARSCYLTGVAASAAKSFIANLARDYALNLGFNRLGGHSNFLLVSAVCVPAAGSSCRPRSRRWTWTHSRWVWGGSTQVD